VSALSRRVAAGKYDAHDRATRLGFTGPGYLPVDINKARFIGIRLANRVFFGFVHCAVFFSPAFRFNRHPANVPPIHI